MPLRNLYSLRGPVSDCMEPLLFSLCKSLLIIAASVLVCVCLCLEETLLSL